MSTIHLIHGYIGSGKTTFAKKLEHDIKCIRFTVDEWMISLYGDNPPANSFRQNEDRIKNLIWQVAQQLLTIGQDVIIDSGVWKKADRDEWRLRAKNLEVNLKLYEVSCSLSVAKSRTLKRTEDMPDGTLVIDEDAFDTLLTHFEKIDHLVEDCIVIKTD